MRFLAPIDKGLYLRRVPLFGDLPADSLSVLSEYATEELIPKGTVFQEAGAPVETVRAIVEGAVSCALPDGGTFLLGPDSVTGVFEFFAGPTIAGLTAKEDVLSLAIPSSTSSAGSVARSSAPSSTLPGSRAAPAPPSFLSTPRIPSSGRWSESSPSGRPWRSERRASTGWLRSPASRA